MSPQTATLAHILTGELAELDRLTAAHTQARKPVHVSKLMLLLPLLAGLALLLLLGCTPHTQLGTPASTTPNAPATATLGGDLANEDTTDPAGDLAQEDTGDGTLAGQGAQLDPTGTACGDATPNVLTAVAISDPARYGTTQTRCLVLPAAVANAGPSALTSLCSTAAGAVDLATDAPTVTCANAR